MDGNTHTSAYMRNTPMNTAERMQRLLDKGDRACFARQPDPARRTRSYFRGEQIEGDGPPSRYVIVRLGRAAGIAAVHAAKLRCARYGSEAVA